MLNNLYLNSIKIVKSPYFCSPGFKKNPKNTVWNRVIYNKINTIRLNSSIDTLCCEFSRKGMLYMLGGWKFRVEQMKRKASTVYVITLCQLYTLMPWGSSLDSRPFYALGYILGQVCEIVILSKFYVDHSMYRSCTCIVCVSDHY